MNEMAAYVESFREGDRWIESGAADFQHGICIMV